VRPSPKRPPLSIVLSLVSALAFAQTEDPVWLQLDKAHTAYAEGEYGTALELTQRARQSRHQMTVHRLSVLDVAFNPEDVRRVGDDLSLIRAVLLERDEREALDILDTLLKARNSGEFGNSATKLIDWLRRSDVFPEADYLEGLIHDAEGETAIALRLYLKAWENRGFLDIPDQKYDILYRMAASSLGLGDSDTAEKDFLQILSDDPVYGTPDIPSATLKAMKNTLIAPGGIEKFITLYRHENPKALRAGIGLSRIYLGKNGNAERALNVTVYSACMAVSMVDRVLKSRRLTWDGTSLKSLFLVVSKSEEVSSWASGEAVWEPFTLLSQSLAASGYTDQAVSILTDLERYCPDAAVSRKSTGLIRVLSLRD